MRDRRLAELDGGKVENDGRSDKKTSRVSDLLLDVSDPVDQWRLRCKRDQGSDAPGRGARFTIELPGVT